MDRLYTFITINNLWLFVVFELVNQHLLVRHTWVELGLWERILAGALQTRWIRLRNLCRCLLFLFLFPSFFVYLDSLFTEDTIKGILLANCLTNNFAIIFSSKPILSIVRKLELGQSTSAWYSIRLLNSSLNHFHFWDAVYVRFYLAFLARYEASTAVLFHIYNNLNLN